jgi:adenosylcobinamide kinase/adenosylcobinamide-phosphate guanylyltransferase
MVLIVGGEHSGKRSYAREAFAPLDDTDAVFNLHERVFANPGQSGEILPELLTKRVVTCNEVGCGVIPMDRAERAAREEVGRLCCELAREATAVVRVVCGIPAVIKGVLP